MEDGQLAITLAILQELELCVKNVISTTVWVMDTTPKTSTTVNCVMLITPYFHSIF